MPTLIRQCDLMPATAFELLPPQDRPAGFIRIMQSNELSADLFISVRNVAQVFEGLAFGPVYALYLFDDATGTRRLGPFYFNTDYFGHWTTWSRFGVSMQTASLPSLVALISSGSRHGLFPWEETWRLFDYQEDQDRVVLTGVFTA